MAVADDFLAAQLRVKQLPKLPAVDELLDLYALYKQSTLGDVTVKPPHALDFRARAKYDAWAARTGMSRQAAMNDYVALVETLVVKYA
jgi:acyl-CoA-binding protein